MTTDYRSPNGKKFIVAIGPSSFAAETTHPLDMLYQAGAEIIPNPFNRRLTEEEIINHLQKADGLIAGLEPLNNKVLAAAPALKAIARVGIGMDNVDLEAARARGIKVSNTPEGPTTAVAEIAVTALLAICRNIIPVNDAMHSGKWQKTIGEGLIGKKVFLIGFGRIGHRVAELLKPFGALISACDPALDTTSAQTAGVHNVTLEDGLATADIVSLHASGNQPILTKHEFSIMRKGTVLLNAARGALVDETALINALENGIIANAWLDVFDNEPYNGPLTKYPQVILTPHIGTYTRQCRLEMETAAVKNLLRDLEEFSK